MKKAFTLVELIVVIGIIGILSATMLVAFTGNTDSATAAKCLANMHQLALATQAYGTVGNTWPLAGSITKYGSSTDSSGKRQKTVVPGWIGWSSSAVEGSYVSPYSEDDLLRRYCITNGAIWKYVNGDAGIYTCPEHIKVLKEKGLHNLGWSYAMNALFHWNYKSTPMARGFHGLWYDSFKRADRKLLFAELPFQTVSTLSTQESPTFSTGAARDNDPILQYQNGEGSGTEVIGFNHKSGKKDVFAHVCFADGHTEKLRLPRDPNESNLRDLTMWLCYPTDTGISSGRQIDISFTGSRYEAISTSK